MVEFIIHVDPWQWFYDFPCVIPPLYDSFHCHSLHKMCNKHPSNSLPVCLFICWFAFLSTNGRTSLLGIRRLAPCFGFRGEMPGLPWEAGLRDNEYATLLLPRTTLFHVREAGQSRWWMAGKVSRIRSCLKSHRVPSGARGTVVRTSAWGRNTWKR